MFILNPRARRLSVFRTYTFKKKKKTRETICIILLFVRFRCNDKKFKIPNGSLKYAANEFETYYTYIYIYYV